MRRIDLNRSLTEIERDDWGDPSYPSALVTTCHALRRKPLNAFTPADLRIMIGQRISLPILVPLALDRLEREPFLDATFYPGDLLRAMLAVDASFWSDHPRELTRFQRVLTIAESIAPSLDAEDEKTFREALAASVNRLIG